MHSLVKECTAILRQRTRYWLIEGKTTLLSEKKYPFPRDKLPIMCKFNKIQDYPSFTGYESGNRSILMPSDGKWFKAKAIGIPEGISQPVYHDHKIFTYHLDAEERMCHISLLWGFMEKDEADSEILGNEIAKAIDMPIFLVGRGLYSSINYISFRDTQDLFTYLKNESSEEDILKKFLENSTRTEAFCIFYIVPSDLRVDEILYGLIFPRAGRIVDRDDCKAYVKWLGSSCANNLRKVHDQGILHGTYNVPKWFNESRYQRIIHSNAYTGNHVVGETETWIVDYDLARQAEPDNKSDFDDEIEALIYLQNPLFYGKGYMKNSLRNDFREELAREFKEGVNIGYGNDVFQIESKLKRRMLKILTQTKKAMWELYNLPTALTRARDYIEYVIMKKKISEEEFKRATKSIDGPLEDTCSLH